MRHLAYIIPFAVAAFLSCNARPQTNDAAEEANAPKPFAVVRDSVVLDTVISNNKIRFRFLADLPTPGSEAAAPVGTELIKILPTEHKLRTTGNVKVALEEMADSFMNEFAGQEPMTDMGTEIASSIDGELKLVYQTPQLATFNLSSYTYYAGAAHGSGLFVHQSFLLPTGRAVTWNSLFTPQGKKQLVPMLKQALRRQYYKQNVPCFVTDAGSFPFDLPGADPALLKNGVVFNWGEYEIGPYAEGRPSCILPYTTVAKFLTPEARTLLVKAGLLRGQR